MLLKRFSVMKFIICLMCIVSFGFANECEEKIAKLEYELKYAQKYDNKSKAKDLENAISVLKVKCGENPNYYKELLQNKQEKQGQIEALEKELDTLNDNKNSMPKAEYQSKKEKLKAQKDSLKQELKALEIY